MFGMIILCWLINSVRIRLLLGEQRGQLGRLNSLGVVISTEFAMCATPGGSGGPLTLMVLLARNGIRPAHGSAVFAMDQLSDLLVFFLRTAGDRVVRSVPQPQPTPGVAVGAQCGIDGGRSVQRCAAGALSSPPDTPERHLAPAMQGKHRDSPALGRAKCCASWRHLPKR